MHIRPRICPCLLQEGVRFIVKNAGNLPASELEEPLGQVEQRRGKGRDSGQLSDPYSCISTLPFA